MMQIDPKALEAAVKILNRRFAQDEFYITAAARCAITAYLEALPPTGDVGELVKRLERCKTRTCFTASVAIYALNGQAVCLAEKDARIQELLEANNAYLERAQTAERQRDHYQSTAAWCAEHMHIANRRVNETSARAERLGAVLREANAHIDEILEECRNNVSNPIVAERMIDRIEEHATSARAALSTTPNKVARDE